MKIGIDARFYGTENKGLGRYTQKLIEYLEKNDSNSDHQYYIFFNTKSYRLFKPKNPQKFKKIKINYRWYGWKEQIFFPFILRKYHLDLMHFCHFNVPFFYQKKFIVTIHDLILLNFPTFRNTTLNKYYYKLKLFFYHQVISCAIKKSKKIIAVSEFTKKDILKNFNVDTKKITVIKEGFSFLNKIKTDTANCQKILTKYSIKIPYLLYVGNGYPHKNLKRLCHAFKKIKINFSQLSLVLVGKNDYFYNCLKKDIQKNNIRDIIILEDIPDKDLQLLYKQARAFVFPSLYEGFGLPPLEALYYGTSIISSNQSSMPEILGKAALYFNPRDVSAIQSAIEKELNSGEADKLLKKYRRKQLSKYSWKKMAKEILAVYEKMNS